MPHDVSKKIFSEIATSSWFLKLIVIYRHTHFSRSHLLSRSRRGAKSTLSSPRSMTANSQPPPPAVQCTSASQHVGVQALSSGNDSIRIIHKFSNRLKIVVPGLFVFPEFISAVEEAQLLEVFGANARVWCVRGLGNLISHHCSTSIPLLDICCNITGSVSKLIDKQPWQTSIRRRLGMK